MRINKLSEIDYEKNSVVSFDATVIDIPSDGDGEKKPFKVIFKLEESGELITCSSWKFEALDTLKKAITTDDVFNITGQAGNYGNYGNQIRVGTIASTGLHSNKKIISTVNSDVLKNEVTVLVNTYIPENSPLYKIVLDLVINNNNFWKWPAATKIHHAYAGGLAKHSLNVCKNAIAIANNYNKSNCDIALITAGALLHDIGKLDEYNEDGSRTKYGDLIPHPVSGYQKILKYAYFNNIDPVSNTEFLMLEHIILSHHEKLEFGAPVVPSILEARIVAKADALDAAFEASDKELTNLPLYETSERLLALDGDKIFKWHN